MRLSALWLVLAVLGTSATAAPPPAPNPAIADLPGQLQRAARRHDASAFASLFAPDAVVSEDGREVAHGAEQIRDWVADQFARGVSFGVRAAVISPREIWTADEIAVDHPGPGQSGALHGRMVRYRLEGARIGSMDIIDVPGSTVYSPAPAF